jgi:hypothetical protein
MPPTAPLDCPGLPRTSAGLGHREGAPDPRLRPPQQGRSLLRLVQGLFGVCELRHRARRRGVAGGRAWWRAQQHTAAHAHTWLPTAGECSHSCGCVNINGRATPGGSLESCAATPAVSPRYPWTSPSTTWWGGGGFACEPRKKQTPHVGGLHAVAAQSNSLSAVYHVCGQDHQGLGPAQPQVLADDSRGAVGQKRQR